MSKLTEIYPPLEIDELNEIWENFDSLAKAEQFDSIDKLVQTHPVLSVTMGSAKIKYWRARVVEKNHSINNVSQIIWRTGVPAKLGRANPENFPVLYLAARRETALAEVGCNSGDNAVLANFEIRHGKTIRVAPIGELSMISRSGVGRLIQNTEKCADLDSKINACPRDEAIRLMATDQILAEILLNRQDDYELSSKVAHAIFSKHHDIQAVAYPSVRHMGGMNFAVKTQDFWDYWNVFGVSRGITKRVGSGY